MWWWRERIGNVGLGFTDRWGGESVGAYSQLNLSLRTGDDPNIVERNRTVLAADFGVPGFATLHQVHGADVIEVESHGDYEGDGLATPAPGVALMVMSADCVPLLMVSGDRVGAFHIGRQGLMAGMTQKAIEHFDHDAPTLAVLGPYACGSCYEVPDDMAANVTARFPAAKSTTSHKTAALDIGRAIREELTKNDITIIETPTDFCTIEHERFFSYRCSGRDLGRQAGVVVRYDS